MNTRTLGLLSLFILLTACNGENKSSPGASLPEESPETPAVTIDPVIEAEPDDEEDIDLGIDIDATIEGEYLAVFEEINPQITSKLTGAFTFSRKKETDLVVGDVRLTNAGPHLLHSQYVRVGTRCPNLNDDKNADGIIDALEGEAVYGKVFFPLDGDLSSQANLDRVFPVGDIYGNYYYSKVAKFSDFIKDLRAEDVFDGYYKLKPREPMNIEGRVVVVHGVDASSDLPDTVRTTTRLARHQSLPIVCGILKKVMTPPGTIDDGTYSSEHGPTESR